MKVLRWETILGTNNTAIISYYHLETVLLKIQLGTSFKGGYIAE